VAELRSSVEETAEVLKAETVMQDWRIAKLWLLRETSGGKQVGT